MAETLTPEQMDIAAEAALEELKATLPQTIYIPVARWFKNHYMKAGHKRLGRGLVAIAKETVSMKEDQMTSPGDLKKESRRKAA